MTVWAVIFGAVLVTAVLSGVLGMAGGVILMGVLVLLLPIGTAMVVHGVVQAASNGARFVFLRQHMQWRIVPPYLGGAAVVVAAFAALALVPTAGVALMLIGAFPWLARVTPRFPHLDMRSPVTAFICGAVVTAAQLLAGASGPLLDAFYLHSSLDRYQIVASKAFTQTLGHLAKVAYYLVLVAGAAPVGEVSPWLLAIACLLAVAGARIGTRLLDRFDERRFRTVSSWVILALGAICFAKGAFDTLVA